MSSKKKKPKTKKQKPLTEQQLHTWGTMHQITSVRKINSKGK